MKDFYKELIEKTAPSSVIRSRTNTLHTDKTLQILYIYNVRYDQDFIEHFFNDLGFSATVLLVNTNSIRGYSYQVTLKNK